MKIQHLLLVLLSSFGLACPTAHARNADTNETTRATLNLSDGSRLLGAPSFKEVSVQSSFGTMQIPLQKIRSVTFSADHKSIELALGNGDRLTGSSSAESFKIKTLFGAVSIPAAIIKTMSVNVSGGAGNVQDGLVLWFSFKRSQGETITDESGRNNHGRLFKGAKIVEDEQRGSALELDGEAAHVRVPGSPDFAMTNATIAAWVRPDSWITGNQDPQLILSSLAIPRSPGGIVALIWKNRLIGWGFRSSTASELVTAPSGLDAAEDGRWHYLVITYEHSEGKYRTTGYLDGRKLATDERACEAMNYEGQTMLIGTGPDSPPAEQGGSYIRQFKGRIGDLKLFNRALSSEEVAALYNAHPAAPAAAQPRLVPMPVNNPKPAFQ